MYKNLIYAFACFSFTSVIGGAIYEHLAVVPQWSAAPPASLSMFQGQYGLKPENFWMLIHPITLILLISSLIISWKTARRINVLSCFIGYGIILIITRIYFVPELIDITSTPYSDEVDQSLQQRGQLWESLSLIRLAVLIGLSITMFFGLTKESSSDERTVAIA